MDASEASPELLSPPPRVVLTNGFFEPFDNAVATARTCYSSRIIEPAEVRKDERSRSLRDRIARETYQAGHHTTLQHATFQFSLEHVSRHALWSFLHAHPFYNSEQVSQRYVSVRTENVIVPRLQEAELAVYRDTVARMGETYRRLVELLEPEVSRRYYELFPGRRRQPERWASTIKKRCQEVARYALPIGTFAHLYHSISGLTLHRYHRLCRQLDVPTEVRLLVEGMVAAVRERDPLFFREIEDPLPLDETLEHRALAELHGPSAGGETARVFVREFDEALEGRLSRLVGHESGAEEALAQSVRAVLGLPRAALADDEAIAQVLSAGKNRYLGEALNLGSLSKLTRTLSHVHYTFQKKLSHTADSQDQRHRMTPGSRPVLHTQFVPGEVDVVEPELISAVPAARELFRDVMAGTWRAIERLIDAGVSEERALYLLPNAFPIRFHESGELLHWHHKWVHRLCYTAQEEIWSASRDEVMQVRAVHPRLGVPVQPPCTLRRQAGVTPFCPEGPRYCGVPVWKQDVPELVRAL